MTRQRHNYKALGHLDDGCAYCGEPATEWDHLVPIRWSDVMGVTVEGRVVVPACRSCNSEASGWAFDSFAEKAAYIAARLRRRLTDDPIELTADEVAKRLEEYRLEYGPTLRSTLVRKLQKEQRLARRLRVLDARSLGEGAGE